MAGPVVHRSVVHCMFTFQGIPCCNSVNELHRINIEIPGVNQKITADLTSSINEKQVLVVKFMRSIRSKEHVKLTAYPVLISAIKMMKLTALVFAQPKVSYPIDIEQIPEFNSATTYSVDIVNQSGKLTASFNELDAAAIVARRSMLDDQTNHLLDLAFTQVENLPKVLATQEDEEGLQHTTIQDK